MILFHIILLLPFSIYAGNESGHGGDMYAREFTSIGKEIAKTLEGINEVRMREYNFSATSFATAVNQVKIVSDESDKVVLKNPITGENEIKDAINYPEQNKILINRTRWREAVLNQKLQLVMHEYFGIMNVERDHYNVSYEFQDVLSTTLNRIQSNTDHFSINLFYGRCVKAPALHQRGSCQEVNNSLTECATIQASNRCKVLNPKSNCEVLEITNERNISSSGFQFCEVTAIVK